MIITSKRIRRDWAPLTASVSVCNDTPNSPITQVYDQESSGGARFNPDRTLTPLVLRPVVRLSAPDGSMPEPLSNKDIGEMKWYANGEEIALNDSLMTTDTDSGEDRGVLTIKKNLAPKERVELHFECVVNDRRTGANHRLVSEKIVLSTVNKSDDDFCILLSDDNRQTYNPLDDSLRLAEYKKAHGIKLKTNELENAMLDSCNYKRTVYITVMRGRQPMTEGLLIKLYKIGSDGRLGEELTTDNSPEIAEISNDRIKLDMRLADNVCFAIVAHNTKDNERIVALQTFACKMHYPAVNIELKNECSIRPEADTHYNEVLVSERGKSIEYPGAFFRTVWKTETAADGGVAVKRAEGSTAKISIAESGIGDTSVDDWIDVSAEVDFRSFDVATDSDGNVLTDFSGNEYVFS